MEHLFFRSEKLLNVWAFQYVRCNTMTKWGCYVPGWPRAAGAVLPPTMWFGYSRSSF